MQRWLKVLLLLVVLCISRHPVVCQEDGGDAGEGDAAGEEVGPTSNVLEGAMQGDIYLIEKGLKQGKESIDVTNGAWWGGPWRLDGGVGGFPTLALPAFSRRMHVCCCCSPCPCSHLARAVNGWSAAMMTVARGDLATLKVSFFSFEP